MTGYGRGDAVCGHQRIAVQVKSVNHRFVDIKLRGVPLDPAVEEQVAATIRRHVKRGSIAATIRVEGAGATATLRPDTAAARQLHHELVELACELGIEPKVPLSMLCVMPGVMVPRGAKHDEAQAVVTAIGVAMEHALAALVAMRMAEGVSLCADLSVRIARVEELAEKVRVVAAASPIDARRRLEERVARLLKDVAAPVNESRLAQEIALIADRQDVTEEVVRIGSHVKQFRKLMRGKEAVGRRLDFLVQELGREINTVGSKSQSAEIAALVIEAKAELEKIREQVQNVE